MSLELPLIEDPHDQDTISATASVRPGQAVELVVNHYFFDWVDVETSNLAEECTDWMTVELAWSDVDGTEPLEVTWQSLFIVEVEFELTLAIDFRALE